MPVSVPEFLYKNSERNGAQAFGSSFKQTEGGEGGLKHAASQASLNFFKRRVPHALNSINKLKENGRGGNIG